MKRTDKRRPTGRWAPWVALLVMAVVVAAAVFAYLDPESLDPDAADSSGDAPAPVQEGIACPPLEKVRSELADVEVGDFEDQESDFREAVEAAERQAIRALDTTGIAFGRVEEMALRIAADVQGTNESRSRQRIEERLATARKVCDEQAS